ncbi:hypothetical protein [Maribacter sp. IgM3_T14_3]|uniref:hypothetical protein n=1 Tax=Maribacter sp. IgM3_T14_3 TaxID=3415140 RepID=UPI003C6FBE03
MKLYIIHLSLFGILFLAACSKNDTDRKIEFWTDNDLSNTTFNRVFIDDTPIGVLTTSVDMTNCGNDANIEFSFPMNSVVTVSLRNMNNETILFGNIGLGDFSSGLSVDKSNATIGTSISVDGTSNDTCTRVYLSWE